MKKIVQLTKYGRLAASTRQRFDQYRPFLEDGGFEIDLISLLEDDYLENLYRGRKRKGKNIFRGYLRRMGWLLARSDADIIWVHCEAFPYLPGVFERLLRVPGVPIVFDYDDAIFHNYDLHRNSLVKAFLGKKLSATISSAALSFCGNRYLEDYARQFCKDTVIVPTVVDTDIYDVAEKRVPVVNGVIGWIGTPSTWKEYMVPIMPMLSELASTAGGTLAAVGAGPDVGQTAHLQILPWTEDTEVARIQEMDIGIMPLTDTPWARGKCGYKLIQYMACGLPVVASPVGVNAEIVEHGVNGFLAETDEEWRSALTTLLLDPDLRQKMGAAGRRKVEREYSLQVWGPRVAKMLKDVAEKGRQCST